MHLSPWTLLAFAVAHLLGVVTSLVALLRTRTAQGTVAWIVSLNTLPWLAVPAWWLFGRSRFEGYVSARRGEDRELDELSKNAAREVEPFGAEFSTQRGGIRATEQLARMPLLRGNTIEILVDGEEIYRSIFEGMERARTSLLVQFYTVRADETGARLSDILCRKAREGVAVRFLYDGAGSHALPDAWLDTLTRAGVLVAGFQLKRGIQLRSQLNFRNHRKIVVVDGREGWVGGANIGREYLGRDPDIGDWRETHLRVAGPAALGLQLSFIEDWHWVTHEIPELDWTPVPAPGGADMCALMVPSGPADPMETASLLMQHALHSADHRFWVSTPYFVPDEGVMSALILAQLRGADVRLMVPGRSDSLLVYLASFCYFQPLLDAGVAVYIYEEGFLHAKSFLLDDGVVGVGSVNFDNRSFRLNFEVTAVVVDGDVAARMEEVFKADFARCRLLTQEDLDAMPLWKRLASRAARLLSPVL